MAVVVAPTKSNLIKSKASLDLSEKGYDLLDKKRNVLIREMMELVEKAKEIQSHIYETIDEAYRSLETVNITMGIKNVEDIAHSIPMNEDFKILQKSVMGVDIPIIKYKEVPITPSYTFHNTNPAFDLAVAKFTQVRYMIYALTEIENSVYKLAKEIQKTRKRANALEYIQIPKYKEQVKHIQDILEEKEREDFFRLKMINKR
ncbi:MAG TPA: V-type ATP synthase subunit D [Epulopiscium sp.]|nr:V-type ATP synthase subunit D [Candidatus Epulonipiscium sp.]